MKKPKKILPVGVPCLIIVVLLFGYLGSVMGLANMLNTIMKTAHQLLLNTVFYLMGICVLTGALGKIFTEFGVVDLLQKLLRPIMRPLYNLPGVAVLGCVMTFLSDNPAIISLTKNKKFAGYFKVYQYISLANFGTAFGMGLLVVVFMVGQGYFGAPFIGIFGAACGGIIATRLMQRFVLKMHPEFKEMEAIDTPVMRKINENENENGNGNGNGNENGNGNGNKKTADKDDSTFVRVLNALLDGGKSGVEIGLAIIPGVLVICTLVMMFTFGGTVEGQDASGQDIVVYTGAAYQGCGLLPWLAGKVSFIFEFLFGFSAPELIAFPITALGAVGAALSLIPEFTSKGIIDGNVVAVFTAMGMCWSGFLSTHTAMLDSMGFRHLLPRDIFSQIIGGICAGVIAHWTYVAIMALSALFTPSSVWENNAVASCCNDSVPKNVQITCLDNGSYVLKDWYGVKDCDLTFTVNENDSTINITNAYAQQLDSYYFLRINPKAAPNELAYAALYPVQQYSEFAGDKKSGYMYVFVFLYDGARRQIDRGYYEIVWGGAKRQTEEAEKRLKADIAKEKKKK